MLLTHWLSHCCIGPGALPLDPYKHISVSAVPMAGRFKAPDTDTSFLLFGRAMAAWANVEKGLYLWFEHATLLDTNVAKPLFYSGTSFQSRLGLLKAAVNSSGLERDARSFIEAAMKRAASYSAFRNRLAHGEFTMDGLIVEGKHHERKVARDEAITQDMLNVAANNFRKLADLLWKARDLELGYEDEPEASLDSYLQELNDLPTTAQSSTSRGQSTTMRAR
jgi:hypothetical protein